MLLNAVTISRIVKARQILKMAAIGLAAASTLWLTGCAATTTFTAYPKKINPFITNLQLKQQIDLNRCLLSECQSSDRILYNMERGRIAQIIGNVDASKRDFTASMEKIKENEEKAKISASNIGANIAATAVNDNAIPYEGYGYERVMLHHYQAINYLWLNDVEGAGVEVRRANVEQEEALKRHEAELEKAREEAEEKKIGSFSDNPELTSKFAKMDDSASKVKNSFQNAYTFYLSGFIYELLQQPNDAYIDYKKALEIYPENSFLQQDTVRLAKALNMSEDLETLNLKFKIDEPTIAPNCGDLLVLFEDGFAPQKQEIKVPIPVPQLGLLAAAFPIYDEEWTPSNALSIDKDGEPLGLTAPICDIRALSAKALKEKVPVIATRQVIRTLAKGAATKAAKDKLGTLGQLAMSIYNVVSENADLRSWITLPANAQVLRTTLPAGNHKLTLRQDGLLETTNVDVNITGGSKTILHVVRASQQLYTSVITFPLIKTEQTMTSVQERL